MACIRMNYNVFYSTGLSASSACTFAREHSQNKNIFSSVLSCALEHKEQVFFFFFLSLILNCLHVSIYAAQEYTQFCTHLLARENIISSVLIYMYVRTQRTRINSVRYSSPAGTSRLNNVVLTSMRRHYVAST